MGLTPTGWCLTYPSEKYESVGMMIIPNIWKNNPNVPNQQPAPISPNKILRSA